MSKRPPLPECPLDSIAAATAFWPGDWSQDPRLAWIYGIAIGWGDGEALEEVAAQHNWRPDAVERLKRLHRRYQELASPAGGSGERGQR